MVEIKEGLKRSKYREQYSIATAEVLLYQRFPHLTRIWTTIYKFL